MNEQRYAEQSKANAAAARSRANGARATAAQNKTEPFDWDYALALTRKTLTRHAKRGRR